MRADVTCRREGESQHELCYSFTAAGTSVGRVRLDRQSTRGVVALQPEFERAAMTDGRAVEALRSLRDALLVESTVDAIVVSVAPGDEAAIALFIDAGYVGPIWDAQAHAWSYELPLGVWRRVHSGERRTYVVACRTGRLSEHLDRRRNAFPGDLIEVQDKNALAALDLASLAPRYLFFPHWSARVPDAMVEGWECVCFHGTDVPFGRGGSPIQNLIHLGVPTSRLTALRMVSELDAGPVYQKREYHLHGSAEEVLCRLAADTCDMMLHIALTEPTPVPQRGEVHAFARRTPQQSEIASPPGTLDRFYDFIRMLDAEGYPSAFMKYGPFRLSFRNATRANGRVEAHVTIVRETDAEEKKA